VKQWAQAGLNKTVPLYQVFSIDAINPAQQGDLASARSAPRSG